MFEKFLKRKKIKVDENRKTVFFTGSGLSAESGVPTFRGPDGLYNGIRAEEVLSASTFRRNPDVVNDFVDKLRDAVIECKPNVAHEKIAEYSVKHPDTIIFTQNIDNYLEQAGAQNVVHLHGNILRLRCLGRSHVEECGSKRDPLRRCSTCGSRMRPDVVLFGESAPEYSRLRTVLSSLGPQDSLVVIGTQGNVIPIGLIAKQLNCHKLLNNLHVSEYINPLHFDVVMYEEASKGVPKIIEELEKRNEGGIH